LAAAASEAEGGEAYHRMLYALGNDHAGTYFPVVVPAIPHLVDVAVHGQQWARHAALDVLVDLTGSFGPDPECGQEDLRNAVTTSVVRHRASLEALLKTAERPERELVAELLEQLEADGSRS